MRCMSGSFWIPPVTRRINLPFNLCVVFIVACRVTDCHGNCKPRSPEPGPASSVSPPVNLLRSATNLLPVRGCRPLLALAIPLIISNVSQAAKHLVDVLMLGWYDIDALAAVVLGATLWQILFIIGSGFAMATIALAARSAGERKRGGVRRYVRMGCWIAVAFSGLVAPLLWFSGSFFHILGQATGIADLAEFYLRITMWGLYPALVAMTLKSFFLAIIRPRIILWATLSGACLNAVLNYVLIFGHFGVPELGITGAAIASVLAHAYTLGLMIIIAARRAYRPYRLFLHLWQPDWQAARDLFLLGWPVSVALIAEAAFFGMSVFMAGWISTPTLAAHGIVVEIASFVFMVYLGLSGAATTLSARALGQENPAELEQTYRSVMHLTLLTVIVVMAVFFAVPEIIIAGFVDPAAAQSDTVRRIAADLLMIAALFQLADAMQVVFIGLLRGLGDTRSPMIIAGLSYLTVGIPCSYILGFPLDAGINGIWIGFIIGLGLAALLLGLRFRARLEHFRSGHSSQ